MRYKKFETYEHQKAIFKFTDSKVQSKFDVEKEDIVLPENSENITWKWESNWFVQVNQHFTDKQGWQYSPDGQSNFKGEMLMTDFHRRRKWVRVAAAFLKTP